MLLRMQQRLLLSDPIQVLSKSRPHAAAGLLVVLIGKGTKASDHLMAQHKVYSGVMRLGEATLCYDAELEACESKPWQHLTDTDLQAAAQEHFVGAIEQVCPGCYSYYSNRCRLTSHTAGCTTLASK